MAARRLRDDDDLYCVFVLFDDFGRYLFLALNVVPDPDVVGLDADIIVTVVFETRFTIVGPVFVIGHLRNGVYRVRDDHPVPRWDVSPGWEWALCGPLDAAPVPSRVWDSGCRVRPIPKCLGLSLYAQHRLYGTFLCFVFFCSY